MIKQSLLNTLIGMSIDNAEDVVKESGHTYMSMERGVATTLIARPNTVLLWHDGATVTSAKAGDGLELVKD